MITEIDRIAEVTNYNGMKLISSTGESSNERFGIGGVGGNEGSALWIDANSSYGVDSITVTIDTLTSDQLGTEGNTITSTYLTSQPAAATAISVLDVAIDSVNTMRSNMGAFINRMEHAINNLLVSNSNQQSAESTIRDVDFAQETTRFTRNQILTQSATAMLSQANMIPQSTLQLLGA